MRILLLSNLYPPDVQGGAEILAADIATGLEKLGHEVLVLTSTPGSPRKEGAVWRTLSSAPPAHFDRQRPVWQQLKLLFNYYRRYHHCANARELQRVVTVTQPDVVYIWEITGIGVNSILRVLSRLSIPIVFHLGSYWLLYARSPETEQSRLHKRQIKQWLIGTITIPQHASFIAVSETVKQEYIRAGFDQEHIEVIYNGIDSRFLSLTSAQSTTHRNFELLFVGRLRIEKGILVLLKALDLLVNGSEQLDGRVPDLHLNIFGTGDQVYYNELQDFLREKGLSQNVTFQGRVSQDELIERYDCSDILIVPSLWQEPFGLVAVEAMARGLPVIASHVGGLAEILTHGKHGLLVEPGNERALAVAIRQLQTDPDKRMQLGQTARVLVQERFLIEKNARRVEQHLLRVIQSNEQGFVPQHGIGVL